MSALPQEYNTVANGEGEMWSKIGDWLKNAMWKGLGGADDFFAKLFHKKAMRSEIIEDLVLELVFNSYVSLDATCLALSINDTLFQLETSRNIDVKDLTVRQVADARAYCTADTYYDTRNQNVAALFEQYAKALIQAGNLPLPHGGSPGKTTSLIAIVDQISDILRTGSYQACVSSVINKTSIEDINSNNNIVVSGTRIFQDAEADIRNCLNVMVAGNNGPSVQGLAQQFAKIDTADDDQNNPGTYEYGLVDCSEQYYWSIIASGAFVLLALLLAVMYVVYSKYFRRRR